MKICLVVIALLAVTIVYAVAFYCSFQAHNLALEKRLQEIPAHVRPYVDGPFWSTETAKTFGICLYPLILGWIGLFLFGNKLDRKMNRKIALITVIIFVVNLPLHYLAYRSFYVEPFLLSEPAYRRSYINYQPFFSTGYGVFTLLVWASLGVLWLLLILDSSLRRVSHCLSDNYWGWLEWLVKKLRKWIKE